MSLIDKLKTGYNAANKAIWLLLIPVIIDLSGLFAFTVILKNKYIVPNKFFMFKFGTISAPPSVDYFLENFPGILFEYHSNYGSTGVINEFNIFNIFLTLSTALLLSFLKSGYMGCLEKTGSERVKLIDFFILGNTNWMKYFVLDMIYIVPASLVLLSNSFFIILVIVFFLAIFLYYVKYSIVVDNCSLLENFKNGMNTLTANMLFSIKMGVSYGLISSLISFIIFPLSSFHIIGIILSVLIVDYIGMGINKAVLEIYRELYLAAMNLNDFLDSDTPSESDIGFVKKLK